MFQIKIRKFTTLLVLALLLAACGDTTSSTVNTTTTNPVTTASSTTTVAASTTTKVATTAPITKATTTQATKNDTKVAYEKVFEATIKAKSYQSVASVVGKDTTITTTYVAPDQISTVITFSAGKAYTIYIGDVTYRSTDGVKWQKSTGTGPSISDILQSQKLPPETKFTSLPDDTLNGKTVGVFSYEITNSSDPTFASVGNLKATIWYDKENLWILKQSGKSEAGDTEVIYTNYNNPANKIEAPN